MKLRSLGHRIRPFALAATVLLLPLAAAAQQVQGNDPATSLQEALAAACQQNADQFAHFLTADNAAFFSKLPSSERTALMKRFVLLELPGEPLLSNDTQGHLVLRCEAPGVTSKMQFGTPRVRDNLAFIPVDFVGVRPARFGLIREGGEWKLLSVDLMLLDLPQLAQRWQLADLEARETAAIAALRKIAEALSTYQRAFGKLPESLTQLGPAQKGGISPETAGLLDAETAAGSKGGYVFRYTIVPPSNPDGQQGFELAATPAEYGKTGRRSFFLDSSGDLRGGDKHGAVATIQDPRIEPPDRP